ncbi:aminotransferase class V-fold PLP-dependent enzyme [Halomonas daqiaonensis]|uniref:Aspartate aminotransferase n=1 Tax=Halomonas daqiaonensis TaxID=650850 RepID=A0A1H7V3Z3_9GAMM|nr:aminotransferase class V-fold PLP-dependent enzyme [Halomonas daqiaonensis]SEM03886.1 aspartate aminotransferase [Halomonas daqiaonensis]
MAGLLPDVDPDGLLEYSVVYTDRALNHMSKSFQGVMRDVSSTLKDVYNAHSTVIVPGSGTFGMEAVARQFAKGRNCLVIRNGWFSYRWSQILEMGKIPAEVHVLKARRLDEDDSTSPFAPPSIEEVVESIHDQQPDIVFAPHVETASGMLLPDDYLRQIADAIHEQGGLFVLDCIASGTLWVDMQDIGVDVLVTAPQKGWSASPCCGMVMLSRQAREIIEETTSTSFACDLKKWLSIMETYEAGGHAYHATLPTDGLRQLRDVMRETQQYGFDKVRDEQWEVGQRVRGMLAKHGFRSVAAPGFEAPGVVVCYTEDEGIVGKFLAAGVQVATGVPLMCDEGDDYRAFRIGLFGLDKLHHPERTLESLETALAKVQGAEG